MPGHRQSWFRFLMVFFSLVMQGRGQCPPHYGIQLLPFTSSAVNCLLITVPFFFFFLWHFDLIPSHGLPFLGLHSHSDWTHHTRYDCSEWVISLMQRPLPDNTQCSQETNIRAPCEIQTQSQQASGCRTTPWTMWPLGSTLFHLTVYSPQFLTVVCFFSATSNKVLEKVKCIVPRLLIKEQYNDFSLLHWRHCIVVLSAVVGQCMPFSIQWQTDHLGVIWSVFINT